MKLKGCEGCWEGDRREKRKGMGLMGMDAPDSKVEVRGETGVRETMRGS